MARYEFSDREKFINPYNFVPLGARKKISVTSKDEALHTGVINCRLITRTPLIIPDASERTPYGGVKDHYFYPFMEINGKKAIPASSLRGPVRSVYETLTDSCFATERDKHTISNRAKKPFKPGLLIYFGNKWRLFEAERICVKISDNQEILDDEKFTYGARVDFDVHRETGRNFGVYEETGKKYARNIRLSTGEVCKGYFFKGEPFSTKKNESIFVKGVQERLESDKIAKAVRGLIDVLNDYHDLDKDDLHEGHSGYEHIDPSKFENPNPKKGEYLPVWYEYDKVKGVLHFSFGNLGRFAYEKTFNDVLGTFDSCDSREERCAACQLFGMIGKDGSAVGKVRFTDAVLTNKAGISEVNLRELGSPHITYLPFYTSLTDYDAHDATIRGRKYYWHHKPVEEIYTDDEFTKRNATMEMLGIGGEFGFSVYYDRITGRQLQELMWVLCLGENNEDGSMCHKIGHAKPLGFGSVKIVIDSCLERSFEDGYAVKNVSVDTDSFKNIFNKTADPNVFKRLTTILNFNTLGEGDNVRYPYVIAPEVMSGKPNDNLLASHQWYSKNYKLGDKKAVYELADINGKTGLRMPAVEVDT